MKLKSLLAIRIMLLRKLGFIFNTQTIAPLVDERGVDLQPNTLTQIAIQENKINRLPSPYLSKCYSTWDQSDYPEIKDQQPYLDYTVAVSDAKNDFDIYNIFGNSELLLTRFSAM